MLNSEPASGVAEKIKALLDGAEYPLDRHPTYKEACALAGQHGYLIVSGASDDLIEFEGVFVDEAGAREDTTLWVDAQGILPIRGEGELIEAPETIVKAAELVDRWKSATKIVVTRGGMGAYWHYWISKDATTFQIFEDGDVYCEGAIVKL